MGAALSFPRVVARLAAPALDVWLPPGSDLASAAATITDVVIGAHPDDVEDLGLHVIGAARHQPQRAVAAIVVTDGAGSTRDGGAIDDDVLVARRRGEQRRAAEVGGYGLALQLGYPSRVAKGEGFASVVADLAALLAALPRPHEVVTHNPVDKHDTHVATVAATVAALRAHPASRPDRFVGMEGWRDLDWLSDGAKVRIDVSSLSGLAADLWACFPSQVADKHYPLAVAGRRQANATLFAPRDGDAAEAVSVGIDLMPLLDDDRLSLESFVARHIDRFAADARSVAASFDLRLPPSQHG